MIQITVEGRRASVSNKELLTSGSAGIEAQFVLDEAWEMAPARTAVFRVGDDGNKYDVPLDNSLTCVVPPECLTVPEEVLFIGIYGGNGAGTIIIPTIWVSAGVIRPGTEPNTPRDYQPIPSALEQIQIIANRAEVTASDALTLVEEKAEEIDQRAQSGEFNGATFIPTVSAEGVISWTNDKGLTNPLPRDITGPQGPQGDPGNNGDTGNGIASIALLSTSGLVKTYRITMTDDTTFDFSVSDGEDGNGISGASFDPQTNALTITFDDGSTFTTPSLKGAPGNPGDDGYSPAVTITTITGGHRVTITDKTHPSGQSFDVMDGVIQSVNGKSAASITLDAGDIEYADSETYQNGTVGKELQDLDSGKQNAPSTAGTPGQVLSLDDQLNPVWTDQTGLNDTQKLAVLNCFEHVAWTDASGATYYDELYSVLINPEMIASISASYENEEAVYPSTPLDDLRQYITVTATYSDGSTKIVSAYTISGTLIVGSNVLTVGYLGKTATITVTVTEERKSDMDEWSDGVPYTDLEIVQNSYYNNGNPANYNSWDRTGKFFVHGAAKIVISRDLSTGYAGASSYSYFFDENGQKVGSSFSAIDRNQASKSITIPSEAYYVGLSMEHSIFTQIIDNIVPYAE